jgi:hypothetical protein
LLELLVDALDDLCVAWVYVESTQQLVTSDAVRALQLLDQFLIVLPLAFVVLVPERLRTEGFQLRFEFLDDDLILLDVLLKVGDLFL